ncbi:MAG: bifunctional oligoribonuclease/PAP phosphatase NrnA [Firmicutes bacterium]|nr:bifunctional oligoribonuclease/PAP phosphatase NrnA [Bacillota bacterium]
MRTLARPLREVFRDKANFVLVPHVNPDGDAIGSCLALFLALRRRGKQCRVLLDEPVPSRYRFLPGSAEVTGHPPGDQEFVLVALDCTDESRWGYPREGLAAASVVVNMDHHVSNSRFGDYQLVDEDASATGEIVFELLRDLGWGITSDEATSLYTAIATDTGSFRFANTTPRSLEICADLVRAGAKPDRIAEEVFETRSLAATLLLQRALSSLRVDQSGRIAWMCLGLEDFRESGASAEDTEGIVNNARMIEGVEVGLLFREIGEGRVKVALRSKSTVDVSRVASAFSGGGHPAARG